MIVNRRVIEKKMIHLLPPGFVSFNTSNNILCMVVIEEQYNLISSVVLFTKKDRTISTRPRAHHTTSLIHIIIVDDVCFP